MYIAKWFFIIFPAADVYKYFCICAIVKCEDYTTCENGQFAWTVTLLDSL